MVTPVNSRPSLLMTAAEPSTRNFTVEPVPRPAIMPFSASLAASMPAAFFSASYCALSMVSPLPSFASAARINGVKPYSPILTQMSDFVSSCPIAVHIRVWVSVSLQMVRW